MLFRRFCSQPIHQKLIFNQVFVLIHPEQILTRAKRIGTIDHANFNTMLMTALYKVSGLLRVQQARTIELMTQVDLALGLKAYPLPNSP
jgi:hypothetical protein